MNYRKEPSAVPQFYQNDPRWADIKISEGWWGDTLKSAGCKITSFVNALWNLGIRDIEGQELNPGTFTNFLKKYKLLDEDGILLDERLVEPLKKFGICLKSVTQSEFTQSQVISNIDHALRHHQQVIIQISSPSGGPSHFVNVVERLGTKYVCNETNYWGKIFATIGEEVGEIFFVTDETFYYNEKVFLPGCKYDHKKPMSYRVNIDENKIRKAIILDKKPITNKEIINSARHDSDLIRQGQNSDFQGENSDSKGIYSDFKDDNSYEKGGGGGPDRFQVKEIINSLPFRLSSMITSVITNPQHLELLEKGEFKQWVKTVSKEIGVGSCASIILYLLDRTQIGAKLNFFLSIALGIFYLAAPDPNKTKKQQIIDFLVKMLFGIASTTIVAFLVSYIGSHIGLGFVTSTIVTGICSSLTNHPKVVAPISRVIHSVVRPVATPIIKTAAFIGSSAINTAQSIKNVFSGLFKRFW